RQGVDQHLPRQARHPEAGRDPHGLGQGQPRALGGRGQARPGAVRAVVPRRRRGPRRHRAGHPEAADQGPLRDQGGGAVAMAKTSYTDLDDGALLDQVRESKDTLFKLRFQLATGQLTNYARIGQVRKDIARLETELRAREIAAAEALTEENARWQRPPPIGGPARAAR